MNEEVIEELTALCLSEQNELFKIKVFLFHYEEMPDGRTEIWDGSYAGWLQRIDEGNLILINWEKNVLVQYKIPLEDINRFVVLEKV